MMNDEYEKELGTQTRDSKGASWLVAQRAQYPWIKEYVLNYKGKAFLI